MVFFPVHAHFSKMKFLILAVEYFTASRNCYPFVSFPKNVVVLNIKWRKFMVVLTSRKDWFLMCFQGNEDSALVNLKASDF